MEVESKIVVAFYSCGANRARFFSVAAVIVFPSVSFGNLLQCRERNSGVFCYEFRVRPVGRRKVRSKKGFFLFFFYPPATSERVFFFVAIVAVTPPEEIVPVESVHLRTENRTFHVRSFRRDCETILGLNGVEKEDKNLRNLLHPPIVPRLA